ncbi:MAG: VCBS repeat-containing protein [Myxococcota bacterium]
MRATLVVLLLTGCGEDGASNVSRLVAVTDRDAQISAQAVPTVGITDGDGIVSVPVRQVNAYLLAEPLSSTMTVSIAAPTAQLVSTELVVDGFGYGTAEVELSRPEAFSLTPSGGEPAQSWGLNAPLPAIQAISGSAYPLNAPTPERAAAGTAGAVFAGGDTLWWQPATPGSTAWPTGRFMEPIAGMWSAHIDDDGVLDLALWTAGSVFLLRGAPMGGYAWGAGWTVSDGIVTGLGVADVDSDQLTDIIVGVDDGDQTGRVELLRAVGAWAFVADEPLDVDSSIDSITAEDEDQDGQPDISVLRTGDVVRRYIYSEDDGWIGGRPALIGNTTARFTADSDLLPMKDLNGDGRPELIVQGSRDASSQELVFYTLDGVPTKYEPEVARYHLDVADLEDNGIDDLLALSDQSLQLVRYDPTTDGFISQSFSDIGTSGPIAVGDMDGDPFLDVVVFNEAPLVHRGSVSEGGLSAPGFGNCNDGEDNDADGNTDLDDPQCDDWRLGSAIWRTFSLNLIGDVVAIDAGEDGLDDIIGFAEEGGIRELVLWETSIVDGETRLTRSDATDIDGQPIALKRCANDLYSLSLENSQRVLRRLNAVQGELLVRNAASVDGDLLACGTLSDGQRGVVISSGGGEWTLHRRDLQQVSSGSLGTINAVALAQGTVFGCADDGCDVAGGDLDGDGEAEQLVFTEGALTVNGWGVSQNLGGGGVMRLVDADRDGIVEVLASDLTGGRAYLYKGVDGGVTPPLGMWRGDALLGAGTLADLNGDGVVELLLPNVAGELAHSPIGTAP